MSEPFIGQIAQFAGNYAPRGWAFCDGSVQNISSNTALFSLLGVTYGGNGTTTFALPDLRGRVPIGFGRGPGLQDYLIGHTGGLESVNLTTPQMASHAHVLVASSTNPNLNPTGTPGTGVVLATGGPGVAPYAASASSPQQLGATTGTTTARSGQRAAAHRTTT